VHLFVILMIKKIIIVACLVAVIGVVGVPLFVHADNVGRVSLSIPGSNSNSSSSSPVTFIANFYQFAILIGGLLAFGAIVYGGIKYITAAGNPSSQSEGKEWIYSALLGLLLLAGAYLILNTVNPALVNLTLPGLRVISLQGAGGGTTGGGGGTTGAGCAGGSCSNLSDDGFSCKPASQQPGGVDSCSAAQGMVNTLDCLQQNGAPPFTVTEAMPPTVDHMSQCHNNGCCVDVTLNNPTCSQVQALVAASQACGGSAANEYSNCGGVTYGTTDGNNVHINSAKGGGC
jgi:hypothetical protein